MLILTTVYDPSTLYDFKNTVPFMLVCTNRAKIHKRFFTAYVVVLFAAISIDYL
jgi:hypothetical protein